MKRNAAIGRIGLAFCCLLAVGTTLLPAGENYALMVAGTPDSPVYARRYGDWLTRFQQLLVKAGLPAEHITCLASDPEFKGKFVNGAASRDSIAAAFTALNGKVKKGDRFWLVLFGHGVNGEKPPTFVVPGPQPNAEDFAGWLNALPSQDQVVLNFSASSGSFLPFLAKKGRINLSALGATEGSEPVLAEFFLRGVESQRADGDKDGAVTLLEAFNWAAWEVGQWTNRQLQMGSFVQKGMKKVFVPRGDWKMDGKETAEIFHKLCDGGEGEPGARKLAPESNVSVADPVVEIKPEGGQLTTAWTQRRILGEHATLEDCGTPPGVTPFLPWLPLGEDTADAAPAEKPAEKPAGKLDGKDAKGAKDGKDDKAGKQPQKVAKLSPEELGFLPVDGKTAGTPGGLAKTIILSGKAGAAGKKP